MATEDQIERALAALAGAFNDRGVDGFDTGRAQALVTDVLGRDPALTVDDGGGLHDETGARVGAIRRTDSGEWITERQNPAAPGSDAVIPREPPAAKLRKLLTVLKLRG